MIKLFEEWNEERTIKDLLSEFAQKDLSEATQIGEASDVPGSKRPDAKKISSPIWAEDGSVLPCGSLNLQTGENKQFNINGRLDLTLEVWKDVGYGSKGKYIIVIARGSSPTEGIGTKKAFEDENSGKVIFRGEMVDYIEAAHAKSLIPLYGKSLPCYAYVSYKK